MKWLVLLSLIALSRAGLLGKTNINLRQVIPLEAALAEPISPYSFGYTADAIDGQSSREESSDGSGAVRGSYMVMSADGSKRIVNYVADENGFRAQVQTNEPGTESKSPADVLFESSQPPAEEIALKYGPRPEIRSIGPILNQRIATPLLTKGFAPSLRTQLNPIEAPIRLLAPQTPLLNTQLNPLNLQQREQLVQIRENY